MKKVSRVENYFISFTWYFMVAMILYVIIKDGLISIGKSNILADMTFICIFAAINLIKKNMNAFGVYEVDYFYLRSRVIEIFLICFAFFYLGFNPWIASFIFVVIILTTIMEGKQAGFHTILFSIFLVVLFFAFSNGINNKNQADYLTFLLFLLASISCWYIMADISKDWMNKITKNEAELEDALKEKEEALNSSKDSDDKNEKNKEKLRKIEEQNAGLKLTLEKYYEFHHISSIVGSIYDINGLLKFINETIIEIIEADYSTIFLYEGKRASLEIQNTNIANEDNLQKLKKSINNDIIFDTIENGSPYVVNFVELSDYEFVRGREVKSFVCMPISTTKKKYGAVLIESKKFNKFNDETLKLVTLIGYQLSTSIENLELYKKMKELATMDGLTGVYNRLYFQERLSKELKIAHENDYPLSLVILDIDHFKRVNDTYSHQVGDRALKVVTSVVKNSIRRSDMVARYGGEEFVILFPNMDIERVEETCNILRKKIQATQITSSEASLYVTASFGIANYPANAYSGENLIKAADRALYEAKDSGRNLVRISNEKLL